MEDKILITEFLKNRYDSAKFLPDYQLKEVEGPGILNEIHDALNSDYYYSNEELKECK